MLSQSVFGSGSFFRRFVSYPRIDTYFSARGDTLNTIPRSDYPSNGVRVCVEQQPFDRVAREQQQQIYIAPGCRCVCWCFFCCSSSSYSLSAYFTCLHPIRNFRFFPSVVVCVCVCVAALAALPRAQTTVFHTRFITFVRFIFFFLVSSLPRRVRNLSFALWIMGNGEYIYD